jgi:hypothetical protein
MKKLICFFAVSLFAMVLNPVNGIAGAVNPVNAASHANAQEVASLLTRLDEINGMDKKELTIKERRALRKEVRSIKERLHNLNNGVYLSLGAIIIILLLLILLL